VQGDAASIRQLELAMAERQVELEAIQRERGIRESGLDDSWVRFKRRLLTF
jgi:hypothetical protein